jgi:hypothetical protein
MGYGTGGRAGRRLWVGAAAALALTGLTVLLLHEKAAAAAPPRVDAALSRSVLPVVENYLLTDPSAPLGGVLPVAKDRETPQGFCTERVVEIRPAGASLRVGVVAWCGHFARDGGRLSELDGGVTAGVVTVSPASAPARVTGAFWEPDDAPPAWASAHFSDRGAAEVRRILGDSAANLTDPAVTARAAFGLPG